MKLGGNGDESTRQQAAYDDPDKNTIAEVGYWLMKLYGTSGEDAGPRGAAQEALRYTPQERTCPRASVIKVLHRTLKTHGPR